MLLVALTALCGTVDAAQTTVTWTFDKGTANGYINMDNYQGFFPNGMVLSSTDKWGWYCEMGKGVDGGSCLRSGAGSIKEDNLIVFYAHKGTVVFNMKGRFVSPTLAVWTATESGGTYTLGAPIENGELSDIGTTDFTLHTITIEEDGYVAFTATSAYINDISNTYEEAAATYAVTGTVKDADGHPVEGATATLLSTSVETDAEGHFTFTGVADGVYDVTVTKDDYQTATTRITVEGADVEGLEVTLAKTITVVKGFVMDVINYNAIVGDATVTFMDADSTVVAEAQMDGANYTVTLEGTPLSSYLVRVSPRYYTEVYYTYSVAKTGEENVRNWVVNYKKLSFSLALKDADGQPLSGATVTLTKAGDETALTATESAAEPGTYFIGNLNAHVYAADMCAVCVTLSDYATPEPVEFSFDGESFATELTLERVAPTVICGKVTDEEGAPIAEATVMLGNGSPVPLQTVTTDAEGGYSFSIEGEPAASYTLIAYADFYQSAAVELKDVTASQTITADMTLVAVKYTFTATVMDGDTAAPITDAVVTAGDGESDVEVLNAGDGDYVFTVTARNSFGKTYTVSVEAEGYESAAAYTFAFSGEDAAHTFALKAVHDGIRSALTDGRHSGDIYTVSGVRVNATSVRSLPAGLYIIGGRKVMVR